MFHLRRSTHSIPRQPGRSRGVARFVAGAAGVLLVMRSLKRPWLWGHLLFLAGSALAYRAIRNRPIKRAMPEPQGATRRAQPEVPSPTAAAVQSAVDLDAVDEASWESFPASDPPSFAGSR